YALSPTGGISAAQELRPGASATLALTNSNDAVGTLTQTSPTLQGDSGTQVRTQFDPATAGTPTHTHPQPTRYPHPPGRPPTTTHHAAGTLTQPPPTLPGASGPPVSPQFPPATAGTTTITHTQPPGYTQPTGRPTSITATVTAPAIAVSTVNVPAGEERNASVRLVVMPPTATDITLTIASDSTALLARTPGSAGSKTITVEEVNGTGWNSFYVRGLAPGTTTLTVSAPGYADTATTITVTG